MTTIDLPVVSARIAERPDILGIAEDAGCDPKWLASMLVTAAAPAIEAAVRAQIAAGIEQLVDDPPRDPLTRAARIARGES